MAAAKSAKPLQTELASLLAARFPGIRVKVGHSRRWKRQVLQFRWPGFEGLLVEERFRLLVQAIPPEFFEKKLAGSVWLELAPEETVEEFLKLPRSEDAAGLEPALKSELLATPFFDRLAEELGASASEKCGGGLHRCRELLKALGWPAKRVQEACLVFLRHNSYCDCEVLLRAQAALRGSSPPKSGRKKRSTAEK